MEQEVDNKYIENAISYLSNTIGIKDSVDDQRILALIRSKKVKEAIKEIAKYLGLPIEVNLSYVSKDYRPNSNDGFQSKHLVKTDWRGRGTQGITAQVSIPSNLPLYGTPSMINFPINVRLSENCAENPATLVSIMAHELSHIVLHSLWHKEKENEFYTDLTAMMLGFSKIMKEGRKVVKTDRFTENNLLSSRTTTTIQTTTYGYLSDENFAFAYDRIEKMLGSYKDAKNKLLKKINTMRKKILKQKRQTYYFKRYLEHVDRNLNQRISQQDSRWIANFHQSGYTDEFDTAVKKTNDEIKNFNSYITNLKQFNDYRIEDMKKQESKLKTMIIDLNSKFDQVRGAVIILKKYVSIPQRLQSFLKINLGVVKL